MNLKCDVRKRRTPWIVSRCMPPAFRTFEAREIPLTEMDVSPVCRPARRTGG